MSDIFDEAPVADIGHNDPPKTLITGVALEVHLETTYAANLARVRDLLNAAPKYLVITNDAEDSAATEYLVKVRAAWKAAEAARVNEKTPYDDSAGQVHAFFRTNILDPLALAPTDKREFDPSVRTDLGIGPRVNMAQTIFKTRKMEEERRAREEEARKAREEEARRRQEAFEAEQRAREAEQAAARKRNVEARAAAEAQAADARRLADLRRQEEDRAAEQRAATEQAAAATAADLTRSRGAKGGVASLKETLDARDLDRATLDLELLRPYFSEEALDRAVRAYMAANKGACDKAARGGVQPLKGATFYISLRSAGRA